MTMIFPLRISLPGLCLIAAVLAAMPPCHGADATLAPVVQEAIAAVRDNRVGVYDVFESSTLGTTASPAEYAAAQRNMRQYYLTPAEPLELSAARQAELAALYGRVSFVGAPRCAKAFALGITGASVIDVNGRPELTVTGIEAGSPADGKLEVGDVIIGSNHRLFPDWEDPRVPIGYAVAAAQTEAFGGMLTLYVGREGRMQSVEIRLPINGGYGDNWPYDCKKSQAMATAAVQDVMTNGDDTFWKHLFLMGCGDWNEMALVRDELRKSQTTGGLNNNWGASYRLVSLCEYYLLTRDPQVLPAIECHVRGLEANQMSTGGWSHGAPGGYGMMNQVGQICFIGLLLARECGVEVDPLVLTRATKLSGRFIGTYGHYGDHPPEDNKYSQGAPNDNGKVQAHAVLFDLLGEPDAGRRSARRACYLSRTAMGGHGERIFAIGWSGVGPHLAPQPEFRMYADNMLWYYELARQRSGGLTDLGHTRYGKSTAAVGMILTLPRKRLRIAGGPRRSEPLFPIEQLEAITVSRPEPVAAAKPVQPKAADGKQDAAETWDTLLAAGGDGSSVLLGNDAAGTPLRLTFQCKTPRYTQLRLTLPVGVGGEMFLNGSRVAVFPAPRAAGGGPPTHTIDLGERATGALVQGENLLTATLTGKPGTAVAIDLAAGPAMKDKRTIAASPGDFGNFRRDGWVGTTPQHRQSVDWFFADKSPEEIARYLPYPDWNGAQTAYQALAARGPAAVSLLERLVEDSHEGIRAGGWDAIAELNAAGQLPAEAASRLTSLAAKRATMETGVAGAAMLRAVAPLAKGEDLAMILAALGRLPDFTARKTVAELAESNLKDRPDLMVNVLQVIVEGGLTYCDIRTVGGAMGNISKNARLPEARASVPAIAGVLNNDAPDTRGMFTDGLMHGGLHVIEHQLDDQLEQTPLLVSGLCRCFAKVPDTDWPGWAWANLYLRRLIYRLGPASAAAIDQAVAGMANGGGEPARPEPLAEMRAWSATLKKTGGADAALRAEALRLAKDSDPAQRAVALSLVWPSQRALMIASTRNSYAKDLPDTSRIEDPATALAVALAAAEHLESNTPLHWFMIWLTVSKHREQPGAEKAMASLGVFLDTVAYRQRGTFNFRAIHAATDLATATLAASGGTDTHTLARGLCKTYATAANSGWYTATRDQLQKVVTPLAASSPKAAAEAAAAMQAWMKEAPKEEKAAVFAYEQKLSPADVTKRLAELTGEKP